VTDENGMIVEIEELDEYVEAPDYWDKYVEV